MNFDVKVYKERPLDFVSQVEISAIYVIFQNKLLLLQLSDNKSEAGAWGIPAGKLENTESPVAGAKRELAEETGIYLSENAFEELGVLYIRKPEIDYVYHLLSICLSDEPKIHLSKEHNAYRWVSKLEAESMPLMKGGRQALEFFYQIMTSKKFKNPLNFKFFDIL